MLPGDGLDQIQVKPLCNRTVVANDSTPLWIAINAIRHFCKVFVFTRIADQCTMLGMSGVIASSSQADVVIVSSASLNSCFSNCIRDSALLPKPSW